MTKPRKNRCPHCGQKMPVSLASWPLGTRIKVTGYGERIATVVGHTPSSLRVVFDGATGRDAIQVVRPSTASKVGR